MSVMFIAVACARPKRLAKVVPAMQFYKRGINSVNSTKITLRSYR
jgi:hypothetical protein